jgi:hypothetical protein
MKAIFLCDGKNYSLAPMGAWYEQDDMSQRWKYYTDLEYLYRRKSWKEQFTQHPLITINQRSNVYSKNIGTVIAKVPPKSYRGLPMGAAQSPSLASWYSLAFLRTLRSRYQEFQGTPRANCWWTGFLEIGFHPELGYGFILESKDGPAVKVWAFIDNFVIHSATEEKTS